MNNSRLEKIRVKVYLPPYLKSERLDQDGYIELRKGSTLRDLFRRLEIPAPFIMVNLCRVNYETAALSRVLADNDTVSFFSFISGG